MSLSSQASQHLAVDERAATEKPAILIVDDEPQLIEAMTDVLDERFQVFGETSPQNALDVLSANHDIQVIISDQRMPRMNGDEFMSRAREISSATRILVTAYADMNAVISAVNRGKIFNYIRKPWDELELLRIVDSAAQHFALGAALQQERELLQCIMDCSLDAISIKDADHRYIRLNSAEAALLGASSPAEVKGRSHEDFLSASRASRWSEEERQLLETLEPVRNRMECVVDDNGSRRWYATTKTPIRTPSGPSTGLVSVTRDITESKSVEQIKDDFIATARHELRTPLTVIAGVIRLIRTDRFVPLPPRISELLNQSEANCGQLLRLINNMLEVQDIVAGRMGLEKAPVPIQYLVSESLTRSEPLAKMNEIELQAGEFSPDLTITADRERLIQVLCNLLSNACKFSPPRTKVNLSIIEQADQLRISVTDQGPGIPRTMADRLFKNFSRCDPSPGWKDGAGLGLRVCKAIVEAHGGRIGYMPAPARGANFFFVLPRDRSD
jgi:two-component system cell cycle sensor histidine kinase PleC